MNRNLKVLIGLGLALFIGYLAYSSMSGEKASCEVCMEFRGGTQCRTALGADKKEAQKTATDVACATLASGVTDSIACENKVPLRVSCK